MSKKMAIVIETKLTDGKPYKHRYEGVCKFSVLPKEEVRSEIDSTTYDELDDFVFRMYFDGDEQATWSYSKDFKYKVMSFNSDR